MFILKESNALIMVTLSHSPLEFPCFFLIWPPSYVESIETQERSDCLTTWALSPFFRVSPCRRRKRVIFQKTSGIFSWGQCEKTKGTKRKRKEEGRESRSTCETMHACMYVLYLLAKLSSLPLKFYFYVFLKFCIRYTVLHWFVH